MRKRTSQEIERQSRWQDVVRRQQESGQSVRAFCRQAGVEESAFYWGRRELDRRGRQCRSQPGDGQRQGKPARPRRKKPSDTRPAMRFLPVQVAAQCNAEPGRLIEIVLGDRRVLRVMPGFDRQTLQDVLGILEGREC